MAKDEIVDAEGTGAPASDSFMTGVVVFTTVALLTAFFVIEIAWKNNYGRGLLA
jgi:hypothetical protein